MSESVHTESVHTVKGMTCGHCVTSVTEELAKIDGVQNVTVDLPTGKVTITSTTPVLLTDLRAAVTEAGYELAG
ncbi:heavy-metal-associated domain-containing protein [Lentzea sp. HUAS TT2]|uniref:heavy-metal-associated domain-containing protein n=1 Tax=Lentzea sp. HUAS TT2 TaxID=3447454 RepID=UPI003F7165B7